MEITDKKRFVTLEPEYPEAVTAMHIIDNITVAFFLIEYVVRFLNAESPFFQ
jgi:hypothetical protein